MLKNRYKIMANLSSLENKLQSVQQLISKLTNGSLTAEELEELVKGTRELYERSVILQYKSFEEKIFGEREIAIEEKLPIEDVLEEFVLQEEILEEEVEIELEEKEEEINNEQPAFDFSLFDEPVDLEPIAENEVQHEVVPELQVEEPEESLVENSEAVEAEGRIEQPFVTFGGGESAALAGHFARIIDQSEKGFSAPLDTLIGSFGLNERLQYINYLMAQVRNSQMRLNP
jgi:hypothetical protein